ncbi:hypothetical protein NKG05_09780 [Oerskovia sp. M15]
MPGRRGAGLGRHPPGGLANDPLNLLVVDGALNQQKGTATRRPGSHRTRRSAARTSRDRSP